MLRTSSFRRAAAMRRELSGVAARASTALSRGGGEEQDSLWAPLLVLAGASSTLAAIALLQQDEKAKATPRELPPAEEPALLPPSRRNMNRFPAVGNLAAPLWVLPTTQCDFYMPEAGGSPMQLGRKGTLEWMDRTASRRVSLKSKYNLGHELGVGSFGAVIAATCRANGQGVAIKRLPKEFTSSTAVQRELQALLRIQAAGGHPNLCGLHEHFDEGPDYSLVLDLVSGGELFEALCRDGPMYEADAARLICQMSSALAFMHSLGTVHADLKPENVMLSTEETDTAQVKIVDFGCSQSILESQQEAQSSSPTRRLFGSKSKPVASAEGARPGTAITPAYCPPEVLAELRKGSHAPPIATAYDMWSLGAILFVMLTGTHPFDMQGRGTDEEIASNILDSRLVTQKPAWQAEITDLSEDVQALLRGLLEPDPSKRLTAADLLQSPWVRGLTASSQKVHEADHRMAAYRKHKTKVAAQFFKSMLQHTDTHGDSMDARKTSLLEAAFSKLDTKNRGYISSKELHGDNSLFGSDARLNIAEAQELLSQTSMKETYFPAGHSIYREGDRGDIMYFVHSGTVRAESATDGFVKIKGTGEFFGEDVLNEETSEDSPRYAFTATTLTPVHAIQISRVDYDKYVKADEDLALSMKENGRLRRRERARVLLGMERQLKHRDYFRGDIIFARGSDGDTLYSLTDGKVDISVDGHKVRSLQTGEVSGEHAAFYGHKPYNVTAQCVSDKCTMGCLAGKDLRKAFVKKPGMKEAFHDITVRRDFKKAVCASLKRKFPETEKELGKAFQELTPLGVNELDFEALAAMMKAFDPSYTDEDIELMMRSIDLNGSNSVTWSEFKAIFGMDRE